VSEKGERGRGKGTFRTKIIFFYPILFYTLVNPK
jgi:hypothetical protein